MLYFKVKEKKIVQNYKYELNKNIKREKFLKEIENIIKKVEPLNVDFNIEFFEKKLGIILKEYNCSFGYQNLNSKKHGHLKEKINVNTNKKTLELKIEKRENLAGKIYTIMHELTHLINDHLHSKDLTKKQKEVVADTTSIMFIIHINLYDQLLKSNMSYKWDIKSYSKNYINSMTFSYQKKEKIKEQILYSYDFFVRQFLN